MRMAMLSLRRRAGQVRGLMLVSAVTAAFLAGIMLLQSILDAYVAERNKTNYGDWVIAVDAGDISHAYLTDKGHVMASAELLDASGDPTGLYIGSIGEDMLPFSRIALYEGRLPAAADEIAADLFALAKLGYSYELGQEITVAVNTAGRQEESTCEKRYRLVGILVSFARLWVGEDARKPSLVITEEELSAYPAAKTTWFYRLDPAIKDADPQGLYRAVKEGAAKDGYCAYNRFTYSGAVWDTAALQKRVTALQAAITAFALTWLLSGYAGRRRSAWYRCRCMGLSRWQLNRMILTEIALCTLPPALAGMAFAYLLAALSCTVLAGTKGLPFFFALDIPLLGLQFLVVCGTVLACLLFCLAGTGDKRLRAGSRTVGRRALLRLHRMRKGSHPERELLRRERKLYPLSYLFSFLLSAGVAVFALLCLSRMMGAVTTLIRLSSSPDYTMSAYVRVEKENGGRINAQSFAYGLDDAEVEELQATQGVAAVRALPADVAYHELSWEGIKESAIVQAHAPSVNGVRDVLTSYPCSIFCPENGKKLRQTLKSYDANLPAETLDGWLRGELAVLLLNPWQVQGINGEPPRMLLEESISSGDTLTVTDPLSGEGMAIHVQVVIAKAWDIQMDGKALFLSSPLTLLVSPPLRERLAGMAGGGARLRYGDIAVTFNAFASYQATDKLLARFANERGLFYSNLAEERRVAISQSGLIPLAVYGSLLLVTFFLYLVICRGLARLRAQGRERNLRLAWQLGMDKKCRNRMLWRAALRDHIGLLAGYLPGMAAVIFQKYLEERREANGYVRSHLLGFAMTDDPLLMALEQTVFTRLPLCLLAGVILLYGITVAGSGLCGFEEERT